MVPFLPLVCAAALCAQAPRNAGATTLDGRAAQVFEGGPSQVTALLFLRSDCPLSNKYAPEIERIAKRYEARGVRFYLVYPDVSDRNADVAKAAHDYYGSFRGQPLRDPEHSLVKAARVDMMPEAAVFRGEALIYSGRIDDRVPGLGQWRPEASEHDLTDALDAALENRPAHKAGGPAYGCYIADAQ